MGQYYKPLIINDNKKVTNWWYSHDAQNVYSTADNSYSTHGAGLKLMEHSWRNNRFVGVIIEFLLNNPQRLVWAGDYAGNEEGLEENLYNMCTKKNQSDIPHYPFKYRGDIVKGDNHIPMYSVKDADMKIRYAINYDKKEFVAFDKLPKDSDGWKVHALPLLTAEGNGKGGGDYRKDDNLIGSWSRDKIATCRLKRDIPKDFNEILPQFKD